MFLFYRIEEKISMKIFQSLQPESKITPQSIIYTLRPWAHEVGNHGNATPMLHRLNNILRRPPVINYDLATYQLTDNILKCSYQTGFYQPSLK